MSGPPRVGVVGVGGMGACHARHLHELAGADLAWVADPDEAAGRALAGDLDTTWAADGHRALEDGGIDALVIACPDGFHAGYLHAALQQGLPTLCEKPLTVELADARAVVDAEVALGRRLVQVGFMRVYDERHVQVAEALSSLGEVDHIRAVHRNTNPHARPVARLLVESIIHDIHSVRWLSGSEIVEVHTTSVVRERGPRMVVLTCRLGNGGVATIEFDDAAAGYEVSVEVSAARGNVVASEPHRARVRTEGAVSAVIGDDWFSPFLATYRVEIGEWIDSVRDGVARGPSAWDGYAAQAVVAAAAESDRTGRPEPVDLDDVPSLYRQETP